MKNIIVNISKNDSNDIKFDMIQYFKLFFCYYYIFNCKVCSTH